MIQLETSSTSVQPPKAINPSIVVFGGILLPIAAIAFEVFTGLGRGFIFNTLPTPWHLVLVLMVPFGIFASWKGLEASRIQHANAYGFLTGFAAAIALFYALLFVPLTPFAILGIPFGLPILVLAPLISFLVALGLFRVWGRLPGVPQCIWLGLLSGFAMLLLLAIPQTAARLGGSLVKSEIRWIRDTGYRILGSDPVSQELARIATNRLEISVNDVIAWVSLQRPVNPSEARRLHFLATGKAPVSGPWNWRDSLPIANGVPMQREATTIVSLDSSTVDGRVDIKAALSYLEWTMVLRNNEPFRQEGRLEILLPPQSVVSRATLWIAGTEREAAFGEKGQVRRAYESVVATRRDPLLVTTHGGDRISVQCFPIEPYQTMKFRIGITAPLIPTDRGDTAMLSFPEIVGSNLSNATDAKHFAWIESKGQIEPASAGLTSSFREGARIVQGSWSKDRGAIRVRGVNWSPVWSLAWTQGKDRPEMDVLQEFVTQPTGAPRRVKVLIDATAATLPYRSDIQEALGAIPPGIAADIKLMTRDGVAPWPSKKEWGGGVEPGHMLEQALLEALKQPKTAVLWISGDHPEPISGTDYMVRNAVHRAGKDAPLYVVDLGSTNAIVHDLEGLVSVHVLPRGSNGAKELRRLFLSWRPDHEVRVASRKLVPLEELDPQAKASPHVARLWAAD
ncbi:MAG TPA: VIT domain-containing protein, partial [Bryobacteraceae bacterium]|nr:VIT domain-containing protein [Bryobacteraceae bacterium]